MSHAVKGVLFDWGGVLQRTYDTGPRRELARELGLTPVQLDEHVFGHPLWPLASVGAVQADALWSAICKGVGWSARRRQELVQRFFAGDVVDDQIVRLIRRLRGEGMCVALLSNAPPPLEIAGPAGRWGQPGLFDAQVFSYNIGVTKPDLRAFRLALRAMNRDARQVVFVDDASVNVEAACAMGLVGVHYGGTPELLTTLVALGL